MKMYEQKQQWRKIRRLGLAATLALCFSSIRTDNYHKSEPRYETREEIIERVTERSKQIHAEADKRLETLRKESLEASRDY